MRWMFISYAAVRCSLPLRRRDLVERPARARREIQRSVKPERQPFGAGPGDHGAVVGAQLGRRHHQRGADFERRRGAGTLRIAWLAATPPAATSARRRAELARNMLQAGAQPVEHHVDHRLLERGAQIGDVLIAQRRDLLGFEAQRGLQARQRKIGVVTAGHRPRQRETASGRRAPLPSRPAVRPDSRGRAASPSCRRPRRSRRPPCVPSRT